MPQQTNLNVAPYFDDFDSANDFHKVLFKPGYPVQARELNNLSSILQNQVEGVGNYLFKEGANVIPGNLTYLDRFHAIEIESNYLGIQVSLYLDQLVGKRIVGQDSNITAKVVKYITDKESDHGNYTLYVEYFNSSSSDLTTQVFNNNETLTTEESLTFNNTFISSGEGFANTLSEGSMRVGSAMHLSDGVYFLRGYFVDVKDQILLLDQYSTTPSYRVGFNVAESLINADIDPNLNDNAQGFNNYTAPGADRLQIEATLTKKLPDDFNDHNFVWLATIQNGAIRDVFDGERKRLVTDTLARRTFDESGHYYIKEFVTTVKESLNNEFGNRGIYKSNQTTMGGNTPSEDLAIYKISPGKAYVKGYEVDVRYPEFLDVEKPRTTNSIDNQAVNFGFGPTLSLNRSYGSAAIGFNTSNTLSLRDERVGSSQVVGAGKEIGIGRVYDYALESGSYNNSAPDLNEWDLSLFDIQTYTSFTVNEAVTLSSPIFIEGQSSGSTGYLRWDISSGIGFTAYDVKGIFFPGEELIFNGVSDNSRTITDVVDYSISDVKSVFTSSGAAGQFSADLIPSVKTEIGIGEIKAASNGISTITSTKFTFPGIVTTGNIVQYSRPGLTDISFAKVDTVNTNSLVVSAVQTVAGVCNGALPTADTSITDLAVLETKLQKQSNSGNNASNSALYSLFPKSNIESVDVKSSDLVIRRQFTVNITSNSTGAIQAGNNEVFLPFDEERYTLIRADGASEALTKDKFVFNSGSTQITINGLGSNSANSSLIATLRKDNITSKVKSKNVLSFLVVNKSSLSLSGTGNGTNGDGLTYGNYPYGTRVQDSSICLNIPDVLYVYGVYESRDTSDPQSPFMSIGSMDGPTATTNDLIIGEEVVGEVSGAKAVYVIKKSDTSVNIIYKNSTVFEKGEVIKFLKSGVSAIASSISIGSKNINSNFKFFNGQKESIYDYSRIIRNPGAPAPSRKVIVYFTDAYYDSADQGDITIANSYNNFEYNGDITGVDGHRVTDMVDGRPRVSAYTVSAGAKSPFEFDGRLFNGDQHSSKDVIASDESITVKYDYYLPRIDRIYLDKDGNFSIKKGSPSDNPVLPDSVPGSLNVANIHLPPYLYNTGDATVDFIRYKRYQMNDISKLEKRINNLEYYTSLNQLESNTMNMFVSDENGFNRFKSGIYVDNFTSVASQETSLGVKNSIDAGSKILRPSHYTTSINLQLGNSTIAGIGDTTTSNADSRFANILGNNIKRSDQVLTLDYSETDWLDQPFATNSESVTPFLVKVWNGMMQFEPTVDVWIDVTQMELRDVLMEGSFMGVAEAMRAEVTTDADGKRIGVSPVIWKAWETTGVNVDVDLNRRFESSSRTFNSVSRGLRPARNNPITPGGNHGQAQTVTRTSTTITTTNEFMNVTVGVGLDQQKEGSQATVTEKIDTESLGDRLVSRNIIHFMRSRNIEFTSRSLKPFTKVYPFFDNVDVSKFCFSKLIEIEMVSGKFEVGEAVGGVMPSAESSDMIEEVTKAAIVFRVASPRHKYGPYNDPWDRFDRNPYDREVRIPDQYSETSTLLNVDTFTVSSEEAPVFRGYIAPGMILRGQNSGADARVTDVRLVTDRVGTLIGSYRVPDSSDESNPIFETGRNRLRLTSSPTDSRIPGVVTTSCEEIFYSQGDLDTTQETTLSLRNSRVAHNDSFRQTRSLSDSATDEILVDTTTSVSSNSSTRVTGYQDPLAQSFMVDDETGIFLTSLDLYFHKKDETGVPVVVQIREVELGQPSSKILAYSEVEMTPDKIIATENASQFTNFKFPAPVYLQGQREYAIIIISNSTDYRVWISRLGEVDVGNTSSEENRILVSTQRLLGSLYKSQNASVWTPCQYEDLTFKLYRASFESSGSAQFFNPALSTDLESISDNSVTLIPRKIRMTLNAVTNSGQSAGDTITQVGTDATGNLVGHAGEASSTLSVTNSGIGYTPSSGYYVFGGISLETISGYGINAKADIAINNGVAIAATITSGNGGNGYVVGDVLSPIDIGGDNGVGEGIRLSVGSITGNNELIITDVQGNYNTTGILKYTGSNGTPTNIQHSGGSSTPHASNPKRIVSDGRHMMIKHKNHGMHKETNYVTLKDFNSDVSPAELINDYTNTATGSITISSTTDFTNFENVGVAVTNPGYVKIGDEVIKYNGISGNTLTGITRGVEGQIQTHSSEDIVSKYELNGISLRRINTTHQLDTVLDASVGGPKRPITFDSYHVKIDVSATGGKGKNRSAGNIEFPELYFNKDSIGAGNKAKGTYNIPYEMVIPNFNIISPIGSAVNTSLRSISGASVDGIEAPFVDKGFQSVSINQENYFDSPRIVASAINESSHAIQGLPANKSITINVNMITSDDRISPAIDLNQTAVILVSNRINQPITDYSNDYRVNSAYDDPDSFYYVSKPVSLANPSTSLQVFLDGYISNFNDVRVFYALNQESESIDEVVFVPFPGYKNLDSNGSIISTSANDGQSDKKISKVDSYTAKPDLLLYREYKYTADKLLPFSSFRIKVIGTSTNQAIVPQIRNLRVIALA